MNSKTFKIVVDLTMALFVGGAAGAASFIAGSTLTMAAISGGITALACFGVARLARKLKSKGQTAQATEKPSAEDVVIDAEVKANNGPEPAPAC